jgi:membrane protein implicated in regulation of membrane protease activity
MQTEKKKIPSNGFSFFIWGAVAGFFAYTLWSHSFLVAVGFGLLAVFLLITGMGKQRIFDEYMNEQKNDSQLDQTSQEVLENPVDYSIDDNSNDTTE